jgi:hypothetical protein
LVQEVVLETQLAFVSESMTPKTWVEQVVPQLLPASESNMLCIWLEHELDKKTQLAFVEVSTSPDIWLHVFNTWAEQSEEPLPPEELPPPDSMLKSLDNPPMPPKPVSNFESIGHALLNISPVPPALLIVF